MSNRDPEIEVAVLSEKGRREENQDWMSWSRVSWGELFIVADGMGGHKGGALAARMTVEGIEKNLREQPSDWPFVKAFHEAARKTNEEVFRSAHSGNPDTEKMGSTVVVALISKGTAQIGHIGDSRAYLFRNGKLRLLTKDHTTVQRMLDAGMLTEEEARRHPEAHILSRAVGSRPQVEIEISEPVKLETGDCLMLCSDGLSGYVEDPQIERLLRSQPDVQRIPQALVNLALRASGDDNITVQFIQYRATVAETVIPRPKPISKGRITAKLLPPPQPSPQIEEPSTVAADDVAAKQVTAEEVPADGVTDATPSAELQEPVPGTPLEPEPEAARASSSIERPVWNPLASIKEHPWIAAGLLVVLLAPILSPWIRDLFRPAAGSPSVALIAKPERIKSGESVLLEWNAQNTGQVLIEPGIGEVSATGSRTVNPTASVSYVVTATGPGGSASAKVDIVVEPAAALAPTAALAATPDKTKPGQTVQLEWKTQNADEARIEPGIGAVEKTGSRKVNPTESVSYVLTAKGPGGSASAKVDIVVEPPSGPLAANPTVELVARPEKIKPGQSVELEWKVQNASQVRIEPGIGDVAASGSRKVTPTESVSYEITAKGPGGTASAKAGVVVEAEPKVSMVAKPAKIKPGQAVQLEWKAQNASQIRIEPEIGDVAATGSRKVTPTRSVSYTATAKGSGGTASAKADIVVESATVPPTVALSAKPEKIKPGQSVQLEWKAQSASEVRIEPDIGEVPATGSRTVTPTNSVSYVITAKGPGGTASAKAGVSVESAPVPPTIEFVAMPEKIKSGETIQLQWKVQNANQVRIEPGIGEVPATGSRTLTPTGSVSYVATATGPGGTATAKVDIVVEP